MTFNWKAVLFDLDGTILDTERMYREVTIRAGKDCGVDIDEEFYQSFVGLRWNECEKLIIKRFGPDVALDLVNRRAAELMQEYPVVLKPGVVELLDLLEQYSLRCAIATSTKFQKAKEKLSAVGLLKRFETITGGDMVPRAKPAPDIYLYSAKSINCDPSDCIAIEDSTVGATASLAAHIDTLMIPDLVSPDQELASRCIAVLPSLHEARDFFSNVLQQKLVHE